MAFRRWGFNFHALSRLYEGPSGTKDFRSSWTLYKANDMFKFFKSDQAEKVISKAGYLKLMTHKGDTFCDPYEAITGNTAHGGGGCTKASIGQDNLIPMQGGFFPTDGRHGAVVATSNEACTDLDGCDTSKETVCEFVRIGSVEESTAERFVNSDDATQIRVNCKGAQGKYLHFNNAAPLFCQNGAKSGFEMCFGPSTLGAGAKTRLESRIKKFTPHCVCRQVPAHPPPRPVVDTLYHRSPFSKHDNLDLGWCFAIGPQHRQVLRVATKPRLESRINKFNPRGMYIDVAGQSERVFAPQAVTVHREMTARNLADIMFQCFNHGHHIYGHSVSTTTAIFTFYEVLSVTMYAFMYTKWSNVFQTNEVV